MQHRQNFTIFDNWLQSCKFTCKLWSRNLKQEVNLKYVTTEGRHF